MTHVDLLDGFGSFSVRGVGCYNDAHIVASHPALDGLTDETLSNWSCSVHEAFDSWPSNFDVLAIARGIGGTYTAPDGSVGSPYILARGIDCGENGLDALDETPAAGAVSGVVHDTVEPAVYGVSPDAQALVHQVNCQVVVPVENSVDEATGGNMPEVPTLPVPTLPTMPTLPTPPATGNTRATACSYGGGMGIEAYFDLAGGFGYSNCNVVPSLLP